MAKSENKQDWLIHQWIVAGIISAAARFIPIPFVDDIVRGQCRRFIVSRTLSTVANRLADDDTHAIANEVAGRDVAENEGVEAQGSLPSLKDLKPYYEDDGGCISGCLMMLLKIPLKLLLFPIRKLVAIATAVRDVPLEIVRSVLLGRTLQRKLLEQPFGREHAARMRLAFDESFARFDFRALVAALTDTMGTFDSWRRAAISGAKRVFRNRKQTEVEIEADQEVDEAADRVQSVFQRDEILTLFQEFDQRFDTVLETIERSHAGPPQQAP